MAEVCGCKCGALCSETSSLFALAVVVRLLPNPPPGQTGLPVLLQDRGDEEEVDGAVRNGHVSMSGCSSPGCSSQAWGKSVLGHQVTAERLC